MGRVRRSIPRSRVPLHRLLRTNPEVFRRWLAVIGLAGFTALLVGRSISSAEAARSRWGATTTVLVTTSKVGAGLPLEPRTVSRHWPVALVPPGALSTLEPAASAAVDIDPGVPLTPSQVRSAGAAGDDRVRVAVPVGPAGLVFSEGDRVDLWSTVEAPLGDLPGGDGDVVTERVAVGARVAEGSSDDHVVVAVTDEEAEAVVEALAVATVTPVVVG